MNAHDPRVAIVTGSSSGNGRAIALRLAEAGMAIMCADLRPEARADGYEDDKDVPTHTLIHNRGGRAAFARCDVSQYSQFVDLIETARTELGHPTVLVNNAGYFTGLNPIFDEPEAAFDLAVAVNLKGVWNGCKSMATYLRDANSSGRIINIASVGGLIGIPQEPAYCATKGGVVNLTRAVALDCAPFDISVNAVCPGFIVTGMVREFMDQPEVLEGMRVATPATRFGQPRDVAAACAFLSSDEADWITGSVLTVDGGFTAK